MGGAVSRQKLITDFQALYTRFQRQRDQEYRLGKDYGKYLINQYSLESSRPIVIIDNKTKRSR